MIYHIFNSDEYNEIVNTFYRYNISRVYADDKTEIWISPYTNTEYIINKENMK